jgi:hypothetical protein
MIFLFLFHHDEYSYRVTIGYSYGASDFYDVMNVINIFLFSFLMQM